VRVSRRWFEIRAALLALLATVRLPVTAAPPKARPVLRIPFWPAAGSQIDEKSLKASIDGVDARIVGLCWPGEDLLVILVVDLVEDLALADLVKQSLVESVNASPERVYVAVMRSQDGLRVLADPTPDHAAISSTIQDITVTGKAGLLETAESALQLGDAVAAKSGIRVAIFFVTDSSVSNYREDFTNPVINSSDSRDISRTFPEGLIREKISKMEAVIAQRQTPLFILHDIYRSDRLNEAYQAGLLELAVTTGGTAAFCRSSAEIQPDVARLWSQITSLHTLTVQLPEMIRRSFEVKLDGGDTAINYRARFTVKEK
jgi:hypothetical protein